MTVGAKSMVDEKQSFLEKLAETGPTDIAVKVVAGLIGAAILFIFRRGILVGFLAVVEASRAWFAQHYALSTVRLAAFNRDRSDYARGLRGPARATIPSFLSLANEEIVIVSISFITGIQFTNVERAMEDLLEKKKARITVSLLDPNQQALVHSVSRNLGMGADDLRSQIENSVGCLLEFRKRLSAEARKKFVLRHHRCIPFGSVIMIDPDTKNGLLQIETKPYRTGISESFGFTLRAGGSHPLYSTLSKSFRQLIRDGVPMVSPKRDKPSLIEGIRGSARTPKLVAL